ncbi:MAG: CopG family antitoxin [Thermodesulfobacteriota bacterium]
MKKTKGTRKRIKQLKSIAEIPEFKSEEEETEFWDTHSTAELAEKGLLEEVELKITGPLKKRIEEQRHKQLISLRLYPEQIEKTKEIAIQKGIGYLTLMRNWIQEGIERELSKEKDIIKARESLEKEIELLVDKIRELLPSRSEIHYTWRDLVKSYLQVPSQTSMWTSLRYDIISASTLKFKNPMTIREERRRPTETRSLQ